MFIVERTGRVKILRNGAVLAANRKQVADRLDAKVDEWGQQSVLPFGRLRRELQKLLYAFALVAMLAMLLSGLVLCCTASNVRGSPTEMLTALAEGEIADATAMLGGPWFVTGEVIHGEKRGRDLGYPTANIRLDKNCSLKHGIYAVQIGRAHV